MESLKTLQPVIMARKSVHTLFALSACGVCLLGVEGEKDEARDDSWRLASTPVTLRPVTCHSFFHL